MRLSLAIAAAAMMVPAQELDELPMDEPATRDGIETVCTSIGIESQEDPRWRDYPVRVEFFNRSLQWTAGADVILSSADGKTLTAFNCQGVWVLFKLPPGKYKVTAIVAPGPDGMASAVFSPPKNGLKRVQLVLRSPVAD